MSSRCCKKNMKESLKINKYKKNRKVLYVFCYSPFFCFDFLSNLLVIFYWLVYLWMFFISDRKYLHTGLTGLLSFPSQFIDCHQFIRIHNQETKIHDQFIHIHNQQTKIINNFHQQVARSVFAFSLHMLVLCRTSVWFC